MRDKGNRGWHRQWRLNNKLADKIRNNRSFANLRITRRRPEPGTACHADRLNDQTVDAGSVRINDGDGGKGQDKCLARELTNTQPLTAKATQSTLEDVCDTV